MRRNNHYFGWGLTAVCVVCAVLLIYDLVFRDSLVLAYLRQITSILAPILYGCAMAYLLTPIVSWFERTIFRHGGQKTPPKLVRGISILLAWLAVFALLYGLLRVLLPELVESVKQLAANAQGYYYTVYNWVLHLLENNPEFAARAREVINEYYTDALTWINDNLMPQIQVAVTALSGGVVGVLVFFKNLFIGIMVSLYLLGAKENFSAAGCKLCYTLFSEDRAALFIRGVKATDRIFSGFVRGKLLDSLIIGILCFFFSSLFKFPYAPLVSVVVGVTNVIPFFGPFLGAIPSAFLILLDSPIKCLYFILFILALQQFDGNILGPRILGGSTGISGFWVIVAILVGGGIWGVAGMFLGVPIFACIYAGVRAYSAYRLRRKGLPVPASCYATHEPVWPDDDGDGKKDR